jgi:predicted SAM-dependent methyltransferase
MRKYEIVNDNKSSAPGYISVHIDELSKIINNSADHMLCTGLEYIAHDNDGKTIKSLFDKLKLGGRLVIEINDLKKICLDFVNNKINNDTFLSYIKNKTNIIGIDDILALLDSNLIKVIDQHHKSEYVYSITTERVGI